MAAPAALMLSAAPAQAQQLPDLVINRSDSTVASPGRCGSSDLLARGRIAIKNIGEATAEAESLRQGLQLNWLRVYNPQNPDMSTDAQENISLAPFDQRGLAFTVGGGKVKRGRNFADPTIGIDDASIEDLSDSDRVRAIQSALQQLGIDPGGIDGAYGAQTRNAVKKFQEQYKFFPTGKLTEEEEEVLFEESGVSPTAIDGAIGGNVRVVIYAYVDPDNVIAESNEANNIQKWEFILDCSN
ncbi:MAG: peptidoglycan-binding protein [Pseudomonadota bacterium]